MKLEGRPVRVLKGRAWANLTTAHTSHYRLVRDYLEERFHKHFGLGDSRWDYIHDVAKKLFDRGKIDDIRIYQENKLKTINEDLVKIDELYNNALDKYTTAMNAINKGDATLMTEEELQEMLGCISRDIPRIRRRCRCRGRLW